MRVIKVIAYELININRKKKKEDYKEREKGEKGRELEEISC
jgi:hypothetical protein